MDEKTLCVGGHKYIFRGVKYAVSDYFLPGSNARAVWYYDIYYCERCLQTKKILLEGEHNSYNKIKYGATPLYKSGSSSSDY